VSDAQEALTRLKESLCSKAAAVWLDAARVEQVRGGYVLRVTGPFQKRWFEERHGDAIQEAFGAPVRIVADGPARRKETRHRRAAPRLNGPAGEFAVRMVRAFLEGDGAASCVVLYGPPRAGKSVLLDWACSRAGAAIFRLDLERLRRGGSRGLVPRKPLVVADGLEQLSGRQQAQRTLCMILDAVQDRGHRFLGTVEGHPAQAGFLPALGNRLMGGLLVPVEAEIVVKGAPAAPQTDDALLAAMKDVAARLFQVERELLDSATKRRAVVAARRTVIAAACRGGLDAKRVALACGIRSERSVREACRWADREAARDEAFAATMHQVAQVLASP